MTPLQLRMFKGAINLSAKAMGEACGVSFSAMNQYLNGESSPGAENRSKLLNYIDECGYELHEETLRVKKQRIKTLQGQEGFMQFADDVYLTVKETGGEILVSNVDERLYEKWLPNNAKDHVDRMSTVDHLTFKILIKEGDHHFTASAYAEYRWQPSEYFNHNSWYVYGDKLALIQFESDDVFISIFDSMRAANSFRGLFKQLWDTALPPTQQKD